jgi:hypothetical protein
MAVLIGPLQTAAVLSFALFAPAAMPAGGADSRPLEVRRRQSRDPLLSTRCLALRCAPEQQAPTLARLPEGEPLQVLRRWQSPEGGEWLQVQVGPGAKVSGRRGWVAAL